MVKQNSLTSIREVNPINVRKLGSRIDSDNDITIRISAGNIAFKRLRDLWKRKKACDNLHEIAVIPSNSSYHAYVQSWIERSSRTIYVQAGCDPSQTSPSDHQHILSQQDIKQSLV